MLGNREKVTCRSNITRTSNKGLGISWISFTSKHDEDKYRWFHQSVIELFANAL